MAQNTAQASAVKFHNNPSDAENILTWMMRDAEMKTEIFLIRLLYGRDRITSKTAETYSRKSKTFSQVLPEAALNISVEMMENFQPEERKPTSAEAVTACWQRFSFNGCEAAKIHIRRLLGLTPLKVRKHGSFIVHSRLVTGRRRSHGNSVLIDIFSKCC